MVQTHTVRFAGLALLVTISPSIAQITGTYPVQIQPTGAPAPGGGGDITAYPQCAQNCGKSTFDICGEAQDINCVCGVRNRGASSGCEALTCNDADYNTATNYGANLCGPLYKKNATLGTAVESAIASQTSYAQSLAKGNSADFANRPGCAKDCIPKGLAAGGCSSLDDRECVCRCPFVDATIGPCEQAACSVEELDTIRFQVLDLCQPVGGLFPKINSTCKVGGNNSTGAGGTGTSGLPPKPTATDGSTSPPFTGEAGRLDSTFTVTGAVIAAFLGVLGAGVALL